MASVYQYVDDDAGYLEWISGHPESFVLNACRYFYEHVLGLGLVNSEPGFWVFELQDGRHVEEFGDSYLGKECCSAGLAAGFTVRDLPAKSRNWRKACVELLGRARAGLAAPPQVGWQ
jgi:hypothetical protein